MHLVLDCLKAGDARIAKAFAEAEALWKRQLEDIRTISVDDLAQRLSELQFEVEQIFFEDRGLGKEAMPWSAFAHFYSPDFGYEPENRLAALKLKDAFEASNCSFEVKAEAECAAESYHLGD
jgi:hypothetical protein